MKDTEYFHQASLVLDILPLVNKDTRFALKGGTAINFFIRPLLRLSVDCNTSDPAGQNFILLFIRFPLSWELEYMILYY